MEINKKIKQFEIAIGIENDKTACKTAQLRQYRHSGKNGNGKNASMENMIAKYGQSVPAAPGAPPPAPGTPPPAPAPAAPPAAAPPVAPAAATAAAPAAAAPAAADPAAKAAALAAAKAAATAASAAAEAATKAAKDAADKLKTLQTGASFDILQKKYGQSAAPSAHIRDWDPEAKGTKPSQEPSINQVGGNIGTDRKATDMEPGVGVDAPSHKATDMADAPSHKATDVDKGKGVDAPSNSATKSKDNKDVSNADDEPAEAGSSDVRSPTSTEVRSPTSTEVRSPTSTEVRSPTSTSTEVRSPTSTSTEAYTADNFTATVTGGAGAGANTTVNIYVAPPTPKNNIPKKDALLKMLETKYSDRTIFLDTLAIKYGQVIPGAEVGPQQQPDPYYQHRNQQQHKKHRRHPGQRPGQPQRPRQPMQPRQSGPALPATQELIQAATTLADLLPRYYPEGMPPAFQALQATLANIANSKSVVFPTVFSSQVQAAMAQMKSDKKLNSQRNIIQWFSILQHEAAGLQVMPGGVSYGTPPVSQPQAQTSAAPPAPPAYETMPVAQPTQSPPGSWNADDGLNINTTSSIRKTLQEKYGQENVAEPGPKDPFYVNHKTRKQKQRARKIQQRPRPQLQNVNPQKDVGNADVPVAQSIGIPPQLVQQMLKNIVSQILAVSKQSPEQIAQKMQLISVIGGLLNPRAPELSALKSVILPELQKLAPLLTDPTILQAATQALGPLAAQILPLLKGNQMTQAPKISNLNALQKKYGQAAVPTPLPANTQPGIQSMDVAKTDKIIRDVETLLVNISKTVKNADTQALQTLFEQLDKKYEGLQDPSVRSLLNGNENDPKTGALVKRYKALSVNVQTWLNYLQKMMQYKKNQPQGPAQQPRIATTGSLVKKYSQAPPSDEWTEDEFDQYYGANEPVPQAKGIPAPPQEKKPAPKPSQYRQPAPRPVPKKPISKPVPKPTAQPATPAIDLRNDPAYQELVKEVSSRPGPTAAKIYMLTKKYGK